MRRASLLRRVVSLSLLAGVSAVASSAAADVYYLSLTGTSPWGGSTDAAAMDLAFGAGNWSGVALPSVTLSTVFARGNPFVWIEGGNGAADETEAFLNTNRATIEAWVTAGGGLFLNAAPNEGDGMSLVFGRTLVYPDFGGTATPVNTGNAIWNGPFFPGTATMTGGSFAHASILGAGTGLLQDEGGGNFELLTFDTGTGRVALGGLTSTNFWTPTDRALNLRANVLRHVSDRDADGAFIDDNCPGVANAGQEDFDADGVGDACDTDADGDGVTDADDNCLLLANPSQGDIDQDDLGDDCDADRDGDAVDDVADNCVGIANPGQDDDDANGIADACQSGSEPIDVLVLHNDTFNVTDVVAKLQGTGRLASVTQQTTVPTLAELAPYEAVLMFSNGGLGVNAVPIGNVLADYADAGGGVVAATFALWTPGIGIDGRFISGGYSPFVGASQQSGTLLTLVPELDDHPILEGIDAFDGGSSSYFNRVTATPGSVVVSTWTNGYASVATRITGNARAAGLNFFPPSSDVSSDWWTSSTDGADLMANALIWSAGCDGIDVDDDGVPDACDSLVDSDADGIADDVDNCPDDPNADQEDVDGDDIGDACDDFNDSDEDGVEDSEDNCPDVANEDQADLDDDDIGDVCDDDLDGDGVDNDTDNCVLVANANQADGDEDGTGDACEGDEDGDGVPDDEDNCPTTPNANQADSDGDDIGDACDSAGEGGGGQGGSGQGGSGQGGSGDGGAGPGPGPGPNSASSGGDGDGDGDGDATTSADATSASGSGGGSDGAADGGDDGGCGCDVPGAASAPRGGWLAALVAGLAMTVRRRRRSA
jgi:MYXO-CTERM domain-containing protein